MTIVAQVNTNDSLNNYFIEKNQQNSLKGLLWGVGGSALSGAALFLTGAAVGAVVGTGLAAISTLANDYARNSFGAVTLPATIAATAGVVALDYVAVKFTGFCYSNAIHHLGPEFQVVRHSKTA